MNETNLKKHYKESETNQIKFWHCAVSVVTAIRGRVHQNVSSQAKMIIDIQLLLCTGTGLFLGAILHI